MGGNVRRYATEDFFSDTVRLSKGKFDSSIKRIVQLMNLTNAVLVPVAQGIVNISSFCDSDDFLVTFSGNATLNLCRT
jgi:hypothetical protein